jgi:hypothetical protein
MYTTNKLGRDLILTRIALAMHLRRIALVMHLRRIALAM